ncbi:MAG: hypothetical protein U0T56_08010 [Ferruginibacter sp.]
MTSVSAIKQPFFSPKFSHNQSASITSNHPMVGTADRHLVFPLAVPAARIAFVFPSLLLSS